MTLWMRALSLAGIQFSALAIAAPLLALAALVGYFSRLDAGGLFAATRDASRALLAPAGLTRAGRWAWWALLAWLALRFAVLALEVAWATALSMERLDAVGDQVARVV
jgi:hypothetical protein